VKRVGGWVDEWVSEYTHTYTHTHTHTQQHLAEGHHDRNAAGRKEPIDEHHTQDINQRRYKLDHSLQHPRTGWSTLRECHAISNRADVPIPIHTGWGEDRKAVLIQ